MLTQLGVTKLKKTNFVYLRTCLDDWAVGDSVDVSLTHGMVLVLWGDVTIPGSGYRF